MNQSSFDSHVSRRTIPIILEQMGGRLFAGRKTFQAPTVYQKNIQPAIVVVVVERDAAAGGLKQVFIFVLATVNRLCVESRFATDVYKSSSQTAVLFFGSTLSRKHGHRAPARGQNAFEWEHKRRAAK